MKILKSLITEEEIQQQWSSFRKNYPPFCAFSLSKEKIHLLGKKYFSLLKSQNGQDFDDYCISTNNKVARYLKSFQKGTRVLLLGTGTGREIQVALEMGFEAYGTTLGNRNLIFAEKYVGLRKDRLFEVANELLPFKNEVFDVVAGFQVFEHAIAPLVFLQEQYRVLKKGGHLILEWPPPHKYSMEDNLHHQVCFVPGQAKALLQKAKFNNIKIFYDNFTEIPKNKIWSGVHKNMLVVQGTKL